MRMIARRFGLLVLLSLALPAIAGYFVSGTLVGAATGLLWGGLVRIFFVHHITGASIPYVTSWAAGGSRPDDRSTNVFWLALPRWESHGTTTTTLFRAPPCTA